MTVIFIKVYHYFIKKYQKQAFFHQKGLFSPLIPIFPKWINFKLSVFKIFAANQCVGTLLKCKGIHAIWPRLAAMFHHNEIVYITVILSPPNQLITRVWFEWYYVCFDMAIKNRNWKIEHRKNEKEHKERTRHTAELWLYLC